jgi:hypothetical protein
MQKNITKQNKKGGSYYETIHFFSVAITDFSHPACRTVERLGS